MRVDTALLIVGSGPAALVAAKVAGAFGIPCLLAGHEITGDDVPVELGAAAEAVLREHRLLDVLRPYLDALDPLTIAPRVFEEVVKQHCVADLNVSVYDGVQVVERTPTGRGVHGVLTNGASRWALAADVFVDADQLPRSLPAAITTGAAAALDARG